MANTREATRAHIQAERATLAKLKELIYQITDLVGLDEDKMTRRIDTALKSEYGRTDGLVNLLSAVCNWPAEAGDGSSVSENRKLIEETLKLDLLMLDDIRAFRGYHTFHTDELEVIAGQAPDYQNYEDYTAIFLEDLGLTPQRVAIEAETWDRVEAKAKVTTADSLEQLKEAVERHKAIMEDLEG